MAKNKGKKQYSVREKQAYHAGRGYAAGKANKRVQCKTEAEKESFRNGVSAARNELKKGNTKGKSKPEAVYGFTADGELVRLN